VVDVGDVARQMSNTRVGYDPYLNDTSSLKRKLEDVSFDGSSLRVIVKNLRLQRSFCKLAALFGCPLSMRIAYEPGHSDKGCSFERTLSRYVS
jgi:hypothetical protein